MKEKYVYFSSHRYGGLASRRVNVMHIGIDVRHKGRRKDISEVRRRTLTI